jgi:hypothetical protein
MSDDLMASQVEVDPMLCASPFGATEKLAVKAAGGSKVVDREGEVKGLKAHECIDASPRPPLSRLSSRLNRG